MTPSHLPPELHKAPNAKAAKDDSDNESFPSTPTAFSLNLGANDDFKQFPNINEELALDWELDHLRKKLGQASQDQWSYPPPTPNG